MYRIKIYVPETSYGNRAIYYSTLADKIEKMYPVMISVETVNDSIGRAELQDAVKGDGIIISVDGALLNEGFPRIAEVSDKAPNKVIYIFKRNPMDEIKNIDLIHKDSLIFVYDKEAKNYLKKFYGLDSILLPECAVGNKQYNRMSEKSEEVVFIGSYYKTEDLRKTISDFTPKELQPILKGALKKIEKDYYVDYETILKEGFEELKLKADKNLIREMLEQYYGYLSDYRNRYYREKILEALIKNKINLRLVGGNSTVFASAHEQYEDNIKPSILSIAKNIESAVDSDYKVVLALSGRHTNGVHSRVCEGVLSGSFVLAVDNEDTRILEKKCENVITFNPNNIRDLISKVKKALNNKNALTERSVPYEITPEYQIDILLKNIYGADYDKKLLGKEKPEKIGKNIKLYKGLAGDTIICGDKKSYMPGFVSRYKKLPAATTVRTAAVSGINNPIEALLMFGDITPEKLYMIPDNMKEYASIVEYFNLVGIIKKRVLAFKDVKALEEYLENNEGAYLPRLVLGCEEEIRKISDRVHKKRIKALADKKHKRSVKPVLTIYVPVKDTKEIKTELDTEIEIVRYDAEVKDSFAECIRKSKGLYTLVLRGEDTLIPENIMAYLDTIKASKNVGVIAVSSRQNRLLSDVCNIETADIDEALSKVALNDMIFSTKKIKGLEAADIKEYAAKALQDGSLFISLPVVLYSTVTEE